MERNKVALERERQQQQQQQERERQEKQCNAEQAVSKHFEESLRRAKEKVTLFCVCFVLFVSISTHFFFFQK